MISAGIDISQINNNSFFQGLAKSIAEIIIIVDPKNYTVKYINHIQPGYKSEDVIGVEVFNFVYPEHIEEYRKLLNESIATLEPRTIELETSNPINEYGKTWFKCTITPVINENNVVESLLVISKDLTDVKLQEIEIQNKQEKLYAIINNTNDIITSIDRDFNLTEYNSVFSNLVEQGYGKNKLVGTLILNYIDPNKHEHLKNIYSKVFNGEVVNDIESYNTSHGLKLYMETSYHPIYNFDKEITGISIFSKNITERILNEKKLKNTIKEKEVLLSEIHHRIKNNLALVSSMLQLKEINLEDSNAKEALSESRKRIKSTALVHEMLYRNETFDKLKLKEFVKELFNNVNINEKIMLDLDGEDQVLDLNRALPFGLLMHELMMNSFKHSFKGREMSKLKIRSGLKDNFLNIEYCDCSGIFPDNINFFDTTTTGLMLIHTFIEQLNGTIQLTCKEPPAYSIQIPIS